MGSLRTAHLTILGIGAVLGLNLGCANDGDEPGAYQLLDPSGTADDRATQEPAKQTPVIPSRGDWTDRGVVLRAGRVGDWDRYLWGGFAATAVKIDGRILLYYQGADGYDEAKGTVTNRAIGAAFSSNGIDFEKYAENPVLAWSPSSDIEEGAASGGAWSRANGGVGMYYGANTATSADLVSADARLATSNDGYVFDDGGVVLDHGDPSVWGSGDELFPIVGFSSGSTWYAYYIPNGTAQTGSLGVAWGSDASALDHSAPVLAAGVPVRAWGPGGWANVLPSSVAIFVSARPDAHADQNHVDVYTVDPAAPASFEGPVESYRFPNMIQATALLDVDAGLWFLYYRNEDASAYGVRTAPAFGHEDPPQGEERDPSVRSDS